MADFFTPVEKAAASYVAGYLSANKAGLVADAENYAGPALDKVVAAVKAAEPTHGAVVFIEPVLNQMLDTLDTEGKAAVPTEVGAFIDYAVAKLTAFAQAA